ncbi:hypothetical protein [Actinopolyspora alba]|uniref:hypothetical protein n=1 Tax=Actinopolyspora alba TaxID=673379 RepID=UPI0011135C16|nr:hypothetical protein [Actinopolyspora alba]
MKGWRIEGKLIIGEAEDDFALGGLLVGENLIKNGRFEKKSPPPANWWNSSIIQPPYWPDPWEAIYIPSGGNSQSGGFDYLSAAFAKHEKNCPAVDLGQEFQPNGGIKQTIETKRGNSYRLVFDHGPNVWQNCVGKPNDFTVKIRDERSGEVIESHHFDAGFTPDPPVPSWHRDAKLQFTAESGETTVEFHGNDSFSCQAGITDVRVFETGEGSDNGEHGTNERDCEQKLAECRRELEECRKSKQREIDDAYAEGRRDAWKDAWKRYGINKN